MIAWELLLRDGAGVALSVCCSDLAAAARFPVVARTYKNKGWIP